MKRFAWVVILAFAASGPAVAGEEVQKLLAELGAEDPDVREAAHAALMRDDGTGYDECRKCMETTDDLEVKTHLGPIVKWLAVARCTPRLEQIWKDRAFLETRDGKPAGIERQSATLETRDGRRVWVFRSRATQLPFPDEGAAPAGPVDIETVTEMLSDEKMTFQFLVTSKSDGDFVENYEVRLKDRVLRARDLNGPFGPRTEVAETFSEYDEPPQFPDSNVVEFLERAVLSGRPEVTFTYFRRDEDGDWDQSTVTAVRLEDEPVPFQGAGRRCVHLRVGGISTEFWISSEFGLLRAVTEGSTFERVDEAALVATRLEPAERQRELLRALLADVVSKDDAARLKAEETLLGLPESREACAAALKTAVDAGPRESLERILLWLDPESRKDELEAIRRERWFAMREEGKLKNVWHLTVNAGDRRAIEWNLQTYMKGIVIPGSATLRARFASDAPLMPSDISFKIGFGPGITSKFDPEKRTLLIPTSGETHHGVYGSRVRAFCSRNSAPAVFSPFVRFVVERASLLRIPALRLTVIHAMATTGSDVFPLRIEFDGEETLKWDGRELMTRRYRGSGEATNVVGDRWWVSDTEGLLAVQGSDFRTERIDRAAYEATGLDPTPAFNAAIAASLSDLDSPEESKRNDATAALMNDPSLVPKLRVALAAATRNEGRESIQALLNWYDPSCRSDDLARVWKSRSVTWPVIEGSPNRIGISAEFSAAEGCWIATLTGIAPEPGIDLECRISMDPCTLQTRRIEAPVHCEGPQAAQIPTLITFEPTEGGCRVNSQSESADAGSEWWDFHGVTGRRPLGGPTHLLAIERASFARLAAIELVVWDSVFDKRTELLRLRFKGIDSIEVGGKAVATRHYVSVGTEPGEEHEYWISEESGIVKAMEGTNELDLAVEPKPK